MLAVEGLGKRYGDRWLFRGLGFNVEAGQCLVIGGRNGSGKSTLVKTIAGLIPASEGRVILKGDRRRDLGYMALESQPYHNLTAEEHLELFARMKGLSIRRGIPLEDSRTDGFDAPEVRRASPSRALRQPRSSPSSWGEILDRVGLTPLIHGKITAGQMSSGMKARLKLALAIQGEPRVLMLDEPGTALDEMGKETLHRVRDAQLKRGALIIATNDPEERKWATHELRLGE